MRARHARPPERIIGQRRRLITESGFEAANVPQDDFTVLGARDENVVVLRMHGHVQYHVRVSGTIRVRAAKIFDAPNFHAVRVQLKKIISVIALYAAKVPSGGLQSVTATF